MQKYDVIIIGAGASGLMCAMKAAERGIKVGVIEHRGKIAEKIRISGGGHCNFTNLYNSPKNYLSNNPHFCKSALKRFKPKDFINMLDERCILYHEKAASEYAKGQLFCDENATQIIEMFVDGIKTNNGRIHTSTKVVNIKQSEKGFYIKTDHGDYECKKLVIASGGLSIPKIGATNFGYEIAKQFGLNVIPPKPALVPLTFDKTLLDQTKELSGISIDACVSCGKTKFREGLLFTHKGLSGPAILQISSYWKEGESITVNMLPDIDAFAWLKETRSAQPKQMLHNILAQKLPTHLAEVVAKKAGYDERIADLSDKKLRVIAQNINAWEIIPKGSEGYRIAEVTSGGVDTNDVSSKTFEANNVEGLHFIGEALDVTGNLGGHNFHWAWASAWCCAQSL